MAAKFLKKTNTGQADERETFEAFKRFGWSLLLVDEDGFPLHVVAEESDAEKHLPSQVD